MTRVANDVDLARSFATQAEHCDRMGAPFNGRVCRLLPDTLDESSALGRRVLAWPRDTLRGDLVPLRCCAGFHALSRAKRVPAIAEVYPPNDADDAALTSGLRAAIAQEDAFLAAYLDTAPQTNEIGRSAILLGGLRAVAKRFQRPLALFEIGASAGLNMHFDRWSYDLGQAGRWGPEQGRVNIRSDWTGETPDVPGELNVVGRAASDLSPLDPAKTADRTRLLSYIWPDQTQRLERTSAAFEVAAASGLKVEKADANRWVADRVGAEHARPGTVTVLWHSVFIQYLDPPARRALVSAIRERGEHATDDKPFAWLQMEAGREEPQRCELRLSHWPGGKGVKLADVDWHGGSARWL